MIILHDVLPRNPDEAARDKHTRMWTGDAYQIIAVLRTYRPDLAVVPISTEPTGLLLLAGLDPGNTVLADSYDQIVSEFRTTDPQPVPSDCSTGWTRSRPTGSSSPDCGRCSSPRANRRDRRRSGSRSPAACPDSSVPRTPVRYGSIRYGRGGTG